MNRLRGGEVVDGRYRLRRAIAQGGAARVFEAKHLVTTRRVALKLLRPELASSDEIQKRLLREARALTLARHPNVVAELDAGVAEAAGPYLAMELMEGRTVAGVLAARRRIDVRDTVHLGHQLCEALAAAHDRGVVHRDVKPSNVFIALDDGGCEAIKLFDFGVAALRGEAILPSEPKLTEHGGVLGTPEYMAPEQLLAQEDVDHRCDLYSVGVTLFECLTGTVPFEGSFGQVLLHANTMPLPSVRDARSDVDEKLASVVERALAKRPEDRFRNARELSESLVAAAGGTVGRTALLGLSHEREALRPSPTIRAPAAVAAAVEASRGSTPSLATSTCPAGAPPPQAGPFGRRRFVRVPYITQVVITRLTGETVLGRTEDISEGGLLVLTAQVCEQGERVTAGFTVPGTGEFVEARALARWARLGRTIGAIGLEFVEPPRDLQARIRHFVAEKVGPAMG